MVDTVAHGLFSYLAFSKLKKAKEIWLAVLFGVMPDLASWTIFMAYLILRGQFVFGSPDLYLTPPDWVFTLYGISHSGLVFLVVIGVVYLFMRRIPVWLFAWPLHILIDIPTHSRDFLPTPFLWPLSSWHFPGVSWGAPWFFFSYWAILLTWLIAVLVKRVRKKKVY